jgi:hypothetical protein
MSRTLCFVLTIAVFTTGPTLAGDLEPSASPGPTMKSLNEVPPTWSRRLDSTNGSTNPLFLGCNSSRFECVFSAGSPVPLPTAVLDNETGLVWDRSPSPDDWRWEGAVRRCHIREVGGRYGWRLPTVEELTSLLDPSQTSPMLPEGHPFLNIQVGSGHTYWTQTTDSGLEDHAWYVAFDSGLIDTAPVGGFRKTWCVRGDHGSDAL